eukprot:gene5865-2667_t
MSAVDDEGETLFPPYSAFLVEELGRGSCTLRAVDIRHDTRPAGR